MEEKHKVFEEQAPLIIEKLGDFHQMLSQEQKEQIVKHIKKHKRSCD